MPRPEQRVILYRAGINTGSVEAKRTKYADNYKAKHQGFIPCPDCGRPMNPDESKRQPHRLPRPNNFMWCNAKA